MTFFSPALARCNSSLLSFHRCNGIGQRDDDVDDRRKISFEARVNIREAACGRVVALIRLLRQFASHFPQREHPVGSGVAASREFSRQNARLYILSLRSANFEEKKKEAGRKRARKKETHTHTHMYTYIKRQNRKVKRGGREGERDGVRGEKTTPLCEPAGNMHARIDMHTVSSKFASGIARK